MPTVNKETTFGIEIECYVNSSVIGNLIHMHRTISDKESPLYGFNVEGDASLDRGTPSGKSPVEIKSGILNYPSDLPKAAQAIMYIKNTLGGVTTDNCGGHVHIGIESVVGEHATRGQQVGFVMDVLENMTRVQNAIYLVGGGEKRRTNRYAQPIDKRQIESVSLEAIKGGSKWYNAINPQTGKRTIEFRIWTGSVDASYWVNNIHMSARLCEMTWKRLPVPEITVNKDDPEKALKQLEVLFGFPKNTLELSDKLMWVWRQNPRGVYGAVKAVPNSSEKAFKSSKACYRWQEYLKSDGHKLFGDTGRRAKLNKLWQYGIYETISAEISARRSLWLREQRAASNASGGNSSSASE